MAVTLEAATPPSAERAVVFACDGQYAKYALFAACQIAERAPGGTSTSASAASTEPLPSPPSLDGYGFRHCRVRPGSLLEPLALDARRSVATYLRLVLPAALAGDYRRLLYLDSDVFVQGGDFGVLLGVDLGGRVGRGGA